jgi:tetratricopeptide (TPR) repeat protein
MRFLLLGSLLMSSFAGLAQTIGNSYTFEAVDRKVEGKVLVSYVLDRQGRVMPDSTRVTHGLGAGLDELAVQALNRPNTAAVPASARDMAKHNGRPLRFTVPVPYSLATLSPRDWSTYYALKGDQALAGGNLGQAISYYDLAVGRNKKNSTAYAGLAKVYTSQGNAAEAAKYAELANKYAVTAR